jgi:alkylated DNA repair dioxygenase AlkB
MQQLAFGQLNDPGATDPGYISPTTIEGLQYLPYYVNPDQAELLLAAVDSAPWMTDMRRRVQHYGWRYDYTRRTVDESMRLGPLPPWAGRLAERMHRAGLVEAVPDQLIVNEYEPGQGISAHIDCEPCFGPTILAVSLHSACILEFRRPRSGANAALLLEPGSLLVLQRESRYEWQHCIPARKSDVVNGVRLDRGRRVSLTFRTVILE